MKAPLLMKRERASALWNGQMATFTTVSGLMVNKMEQVFLSMIVKKVIQLLMLGNSCRRELCRIFRVSVIAHASWRQVDMCM